ncbi:marvel domain-containing protein [Dactylonectria estremocensis]|uniref:Marvel domain-containing protein n=1 Tax=Dactylonectria estremocensis TaxID=1079267 RepID=A0A9P9IZX6_9HYPO|nr:marvel domain-containing protein [Dactylonectria estremocensis]
MALGIITIVHAVLAVLLIIELGLTGYLVDQTTGYFGNNSPSSFSFMLFNSIWSLLALVYLALVPIFFTRAYHSVVGLGLLVVTTIFWFAGSIAMAAFIGVPHCHGNNFCQCAQAAVAFGFFIWAIFTGLTAMEVLAFMRSRGHSAHADTTKPGHGVV